jgi:uncharacterized damage-inducible protein DinB
MPSELDDLREHLERFRGVTLQHFDILSDEELAWRPREDAFTCGQQLVHIIQTEDFFVRGALEDDWDIDRLRLPKPMPSKLALHEEFVSTRQRTRVRLDALAPGVLDVVKRHGYADVDATVRTWLWFILEHEIHHKAQLAEYLRALGHVPPYFGIVLPPGTRPDIAARAALGGV